MSIELELSLDGTAKARELKRRGYTIEPFLSEGNIQALLELHRATIPEVHRDLHVSAFLADPAAKKQIFEGIRNVVADKLNTLAPGYFLLNASFVTKKAKSANGRMGMHQDYSLVEHDKHLGLNVWAPLCDVDRTNGCLKVIDGSQAFGHISANPPNPAPYSNVRETLEQYMNDVPMKKGEAFLFDTRVLHKTDDNITDKTRIAVFLNLCPLTASPKLYQWNKDNPDQLELYEVTTSFLHAFAPNSYAANARFDGAKLIGVVDYRFEQVKAEDLPQILPTAHLPKTPNSAAVESTRAQRARACSKEKLAPEPKPPTTRFPLRKRLSSLLRWD
jgi:hypothetical protein